MSPFVFSENVWFAAAANQYTKVTCEFSKFYKKSAGADALWKQS